MIKFHNHFKISSKLCNTFGLQNTVNALSKTQKLSLSFWNWQYYHVDHLEQLNWQTFEKKKPIVTFESQIKDYLTNLKSFLLSFTSRFKPI